MSDELFEKLAETQQVEQDKQKKSEELLRQSIADLQARAWAREKADLLERVKGIWEAAVPPEYRFAKLSTLLPSHRSQLATDRQQNVLNLLRANPESGYAFFSPPGFGKSVWTAALYRHALNLYLADPGKAKVFPIWRITTKQMLDEHTEFALNQSNMDELDRRLLTPTVTPERIARVRNKQGMTPKLFLEEIDKGGRETDARRANLFAILDALMAHKGQLVLNTNLTPEEFAERMGADLWWRIKEMSKIVSLF